MLRRFVPLLARVSCREEGRRKKWSRVIGLVIYSKDCYMEQSVFEMSGVIFCDCMAGAPFAFLHIFSTSVCLSLSPTHRNRRTYYLLNKWLFKSQGKGLCSASQLFLKAANHVNFTAETFSESSIASVKPKP